jgi:hypothetical protein
MFQYRITNRKTLWGFYTHTRERASFAKNRKSTLAKVEKSGTLRCRWLTDRLNETKTSSTDAHTLLLSPLVSAEKNARKNGQKWRPKIRKSAGFSGVENLTFCKIAWRYAWENANIAINAGK